MTRIVLALALPVTIIGAIVIVTIILSWISGEGLCGTWMGSVLPYCS